MAMIEFNKYGETPLDDISGLIPKNVTTKKALDDAESLNIAKATMKYMVDTSKLKRLVIDEPFLRKLHREMYSDVWKWAGEYRTTQVSIGIEAPLIRGRIYQLIDDLNFWQENWEYREVATKLHHQLVFIHPFLNGNGRWARLATDLWILKMGKELPSWGKEMSANARKIYIESLKLADAGNLKPLQDFIFA